MKIGTYATKAEFRTAKTIEWLERQNRKVVHRQDIYIGFQWALRQERAILFPNIPLSDPIIMHGGDPLPLADIALYGHGHQPAYLKNTNAPKYLHSIGRDKYIIMTKPAVPIISKPEAPVPAAPPVATTPTIDYALIAKQMFDIENVTAKLNIKTIIAKVKTLLPDIIADVIYQSLKTIHPDAEYPKELISIAVDKMDMIVDIKKNVHRSILTFQ